MSEAEKMDVRFHQERLRQTRSLFSIDQDEESLTHLGVRLGDGGAGGAGKGANTLQDDLFFQVGEDEEFGGKGGLLDQQAVQALHFGGGEAPATAAGGDAPERKKTKREIMDEIVAKSKMHKAERRQENQEQMELLQQVDAKFKEITHFLTLKKKPAKVDQAPEEDRVARPHEEGYEKDEYDQLVTELRATSRDAKAADRMQSKEEEAKLRLERLKSLEVMRERRMQGVAVGVEEEEAEGGDKKKKAQMQLDDLKKLVAAGKDADKDEEDDSQGDDEDDDEDGEGDSEEGGAGGGSKKSKRKLKRRLRAKVRGALSKELRDRGDWVIQKRWKRDLLEDETQTLQNEADSHRTVVDAKTGEEFAYVLSVPASFDEFAAMMRDNSVEVCGAVLDRMLHSNDPLLDPANASRLRVLHVYILAMALRIGGEGSDATRPMYDWIEMAFNVIRRLVLMLPASDADAMGSHTSIFFPYRILLNVLASVDPVVPVRAGEDPAVFDPLLPRLENAGRRRAGAAALQPRVAYIENGFPSSQLCLTLLHLSRLFSASDKLHPVWTPALAYLLSVLSMAVPRSAAQLRLMCFVCEALLPVLQDARTVSPEPATFLSSLGRLVIGNQTNLPLHPHWPSIALSEEQRADLSRLCNRAAVAQSEWLAAAGAPHRPLVDLLLGTAVASGTAGREALEEKVGALTLAPLRLREKRVAEIEQVAPKVFLTGDFGYNGRHDPDAERRQAKLLTRKLKQEKRGAMRELRRDREFLNTMKRQEFVEETSERKESMKAIKTFLVQGQSEHKKELKDKAKAQQKMKL